MPGLRFRSDDFFRSSGRAEAFQGTMIRVADGNKVGEKHEPELQKNRSACPEGCHPFWLEK